MLDRCFKTPAEDAVAPEWTGRLEQDALPPGGAGGFERMPDRISVRAVCGGQVIWAFHRTRTVTTGDVEQFRNVGSDHRFESRFESVKDRPLRERTTFQRKHILEAEPHAARTRCDDCDRFHIIGRVAVLSVPAAFT
jgi:hypothetical protein